MNRLAVALVLCLAAVPSAAQEPQTLRGTLEYTQVEGGVWTLRHGGTLYDLHGDLGGATAGAVVDVTGRVRSDQACIHQRGTIFEVTGIVLFTRGDPKAFPLPPPEHVRLEWALRQKKLPVALKITYDDVHRLHGGLSLTIDGAGAVTQRAVRFKAGTPRTKVPQADLQRLAALLLELQVWKQREPERRARPDESRAWLRLELGEQRIATWEWHNDLAKGKRLVRARELMKQIAWTREVAVEYQRVDSVGALSKLAGEPVLLVGRVTTLQWAHLGGFFTNHPHENLFEVGGNTLVVYSKTPIEAKGDVEVRGTVHELQGGKDSRAQGRVEYVVLADSWKSVD